MPLADPEVDTIFQAALQVDVTALCCVDGVQVYGEQNITSVNATTTRVVGPVLITVVVRDGATNVPGELQPTCSGLILPHVLCGLCPVGSTDNSYYAWT